MQRIFVGDVQGCAEELAELLSRAEASFGRGFELWLVGDLVNRGPDNLGSLARVRGLWEEGRARCVLGNHEIALLRCWLGLRELTPFDSFRDVLEAPQVDSWCEWLRSLPLVESGTLGAEDFAMVHAAVHPDWSLEEVAAAGRAVAERLRAPRAELREFLASAPGARSEAKPSEVGRGRASAPGARDGFEAEALGRLTRCRTVSEDGRWSSEEPKAGFRPWHAAWGERRHGYAVVYGHWSLQGLHVAPGLRGLDTGCVHHGRGRDGALTAWLPAAGARRPFEVPDARFWSVPARRAYYAHRDAGGGSASGR